MFYQYFHTIHNLHTITHPHLFSLYDKGVNIVTKSITEKKKQPELLSELLFTKPKIVSFYPVDFLMLVLADSLCLFLQEYDPTNITLKY